MTNVILNEDRFGIWTTNTYLAKMFEYLITNMNYQLINISELVDKTEIEITNLFINKIGSVPKNIVLFLNKLTKFQLIAIPKIIRLNVIIVDLHQNRNDIVSSLAKCSNIFSTYAYTFDKFITPKDINHVPVHFFPHSTSYICEFNTRPIGKILVSGRLDKTVYPFRQTMFELSRKSSHIKYLPVNHYYRINNSNNKYIYGDKYIKFLNKYLVCFTCDSYDKTPYILAKHFEILGSGALLLAANELTKEYFEKLGFIDGVHYISVNSTNLYNKINYVIDSRNRPMIDTIRKNGQQLLISKHTYIHRAKFLHKIINQK